jgi:Helitron helicase-like domain at N-terminus
MDAIHEGLDVSSIGPRVVLASITSLPHFMQKNLQDALALLCLFGGSDLFMTFTTNPHWPEIEAALPGQLPSDWPDLVAHVFHLRFKSLLSDIMDHNIFGFAVICLHCQISEKGTSTCSSHCLPASHSMSLYATCC